MPRKRSKLTKSECAKIFDIFADTINPQPELNWQTPLDLLIAVVLSAQTTDIAVNKVTAKLWKVCRQPQDYLDLGVQKIEAMVRSIGLYRNKSKAIIGICEQLIADFAEEVPNNRDELMKFPGVGRKTANVVLNVVFKQPVMAVDTHVFRVSNRLGLVKTKTPDATEQALLKLIPKHHLLHAHHYLILHGRYTCKARNPQCHECKISNLCLFNQA